MNKNKFSNTDEALISETPSGVCYKSKTYCKMKNYKVIGKPILRIDEDGDLLILNQKLNRWELTSRSWSWDEIAKGYKRESRRNYKNKIARELERELRRQNNGKFN